MNQHQSGKENEQFMDSEVVRLMEPCKLPEYDRRRQFRAETGFHCD